jgi:hypothetical protein
MITRTIRSSDSMSVTMSLGFLAHVIGFFIAILFPSASWLARAAPAAASCARRPVEKGFAGRQTIHPLSPMARPGHRGAPLAAWGGVYHAFQTRTVSHKRNRNRANDHDPRLPVFELLP